MTVIIGEFATFLVFVAVAGGKVSPSFLGITNCSWEYWAVVAAFHLVTCLYLSLIIRHLLRISATRQLNGSERLHWTHSAVFRLASGGFLSGLCGNMLLVGSGMIQGPVLLSLQVPPQVTSATALFLVTFGALAGAIQYWLAGATNLQYAAYMDVIAVLASVVGVRAVSWAVQRFKRNSLVVMLLAGVVAVSLVVVPVFDAFVIWESVEDGTFQASFRSICA